MELENKSTIENEVVTVDITEGDYNDVYKRGPIVRGTWEQIENFVKGYFTEEGLRKAEDIGSDGYCLAIYQNVTDEDGNEVAENDPRYEELSSNFESQIEYYVEAQPINEVNDEAFYIVDLTKEETS